MGSRNGHTLLAIWARLFDHGHDGFSRDALSATFRAAELAKRVDFHAEVTLEDLYDAARRDKLRNCFTDPE